jgi:deoxycytidine triphosphate deaminase
MSERANAPLPNHPVGVLSNQLIRRCIDADWIRIDPFRSDLLGPTAYRLRPHKVRYHRRDEDTLLDAGSTLLSAHAYSLQPKENIVVSIEERITLHDGIIATFYPASLCVEQGLILTAGRLEPHYKHAIVFGLFNASDEEVTIAPDIQIARASFSWLGADNIPQSHGDVPGDYIKNVDRLRNQESR